MYVRPQEHMRENMYTQTKVAHFFFLYFFHRQKSGCKKNVKKIKNSTYQNIFASSAVTSSLEVSSVPPAPG